MKATLTNAGTTFAVAVLGAGWAYLIYKALWVFAAIPIALAVSGQVLFLIGKRNIRKHPQGSIYMMEWGFLGPFFLAVIGAGAIILVGAKLVPGEKATPVVKGIITAASAAVVAALATVLVGKSESPWVNWVDSRVSRAFIKEFAGYFRPGSAAQLAAQSSHFGQHQGWGWKARRARAQAIANAPDTDKLPVATSGQVGLPPT
ncbi:hypothetical protein ABZ867_14115 [Streptomyces cinnamoneus]